MQAYADRCSLVATLARPLARNVCGIALALILNACTHHPTPLQASPTPLADIREPGPTEVVVVINANSFAGSHAGLFAGARLYDPSGTYAGSRSEAPGWHAPALADYLRYHLRDGPHVHLYRFRLTQSEFDAISTRISRAGWTMPMFCAAGVQDILAGIGPFKALEPSWWTSPLQLGKRLQGMAPVSVVSGECAEAQPC